MKLLNWLKSLTFKPKKVNYRVTFYAIGFMSNMYKVCEHKHEDNEGIDYSTLADKVFAQNRQSLHRHYKTLESGVTRFKTCIEVLNNETMEWEYYENTI